MAKTTDQIYDLLVQLDKKVDTHIAVVNLRLDALEAKSAKRWQFWTALSASPVAGLIAAWFGIKTGTGNG
jgi:hypothetical protein